MALTSRAVVSWLLLLVALEPWSLTRHIMPDRYCLACLCNAASNCAQEIGCRRQRGQQVCGPFLLTLGQWRTARRAGSMNRRFRYLNFRACATDTECAALAFSEYLSVTARDCDGDGFISCMDFGMVSRQGAGDCRNVSDPGHQKADDYYEVLDRCMKDVASMLAEPVPDPSCR